MFNSMLKSVVIVAMLLCSASSFAANDKIDTDHLWSTKMSDSTMKFHPKPWRMRKSDGAYKWSYTNGLVLYGIEKLYLKNQQNKYLDYIQRYADHYIDDAGNISTYQKDAYNIDSINAGKMLFLLHEKTQDPRYLTAIKTLRTQLDWHPRTSDGAFWHKRKYPWQVWLDGLYMAAPFYAEYEMKYGAGEQGLADVTNWFVLAEQKTRDNKTGLLYHGWDESKVQSWADNKTGLSKNFWSRAMGWYGMALVDTLEVIPKSSIHYQTLSNILNRLVVALVKVQDKSGLWYQVTDQGNRAGNYLEASASSMFVYTIAKGVRLGVLTPEHQQIANAGYQGILTQLIAVDGKGDVTLSNICKSAGLGGHPYRDGSYQYYLEEPVVVNDAHGVGAFILASVEMNN